MSFLKKHWSWIAGLLGTVWMYSSPDAVKFLTQYASTHPAYAGLIGSFLLFAAHSSPSPWSGDSLKSSGLGPKIVFALALLFIAPCVSAQTNSPASVIPPTQLFTFSGNLAGFSGSSTANGAVIATAAMQLTPSFSAGYEHIAISSLSARYEMGVVAYTRTLNQLLGTTLSNKLLFDASQIGVTFSAGGGKVLEPTANRVAETVGVHFSYPLTANMSVQIIGIDVVHGGGHTGIITANYSEAVSTGLNIHFLVEPEGNSIEPCQKYCR